MTALNIYIGPTLNMTQPLTLPQHVHLHPPAKLGSIHALMELKFQPEIIVIVDGYVEYEYAVSHDELCHALDLGWRIYGLSDIGAIRAYELRHHGMQGYGQVYHAFSTRADLRDDEILWAWDLQTPYQALNEPLIHLRKALQYLVAHDNLSANTSHYILKALKQQWYKTRTLDYFIALLQEHSRTLSAHSIQQLKHDFARFRTKVHDLERFINQAPWLHANKGLSSSLV